MIYALYSSGTYVICCFKLHIDRKTEAGKQRNLLKAAKQGASASIRVKQSNACSEVKMLLDFYCTRA